MQSKIIEWDFLKIGQLSHYCYMVCRFLWPISLMPSRALPFKQKTKIAFEKPGLIHKACMGFMEASFDIRFKITVAIVHFLDQTNHIFLKDFFR